VIRTEFAILAIGLMIVAMDIYVSVFHPGITSNINASVILKISIGLAIIVWLLKRIPLVRRLLLALETHAYQSQSEKTGDKP